MGKEYHRPVLGTLLALTACTSSDQWLQRAPSYYALGHDPGWLLTLDDARLRFVTSRPSTNLEIPRPIAQVAPLGSRYVTDGLTLDITNKPCNDVRSGIAFADTVVVTASSYSYRGCGGERIPLLDK